MKLKKTNKIMGGGKLTALLLSVTCVAATAASDLTLAGAYPVTVAPGSTTTISDKITGTGPLVVLGGGTLALSNPDNDFTGGIIVSNGILQAEAEGCFGENTISLEGIADIRQVCFNVAKASFPNDITLKDKTSSSSYPAIVANTSVTLTGNLTLDPSMPSASSAYFYITPGVTSADSGVTVTVDGQICAAAGMVWYRGYGSLLLNGKVETSRFYAGHAWAMNGILALKNPENDIKALNLYAADVSCRDVNVLRGCAVRFCFDKAWVANGHGLLLLNGHDQEFASLSSSDNSLGATEYACAIQTSSSGPSVIVTVNGRGLTSETYAYAQIRIMGPIHLVVNSIMPSGVIFSQGFKRRQSSSDGTIEVRNGRLRCIDGATFPNVTNILLGAGTMLDFATATNVFERLECMRIEGDGVVRCKKDCRAPFFNRVADVYMASDARFYFGSGVTNTIDHLVVGGRELRRGLYTAQTLPQMTGSSGDFAGGVLEVLRNHRGIAMSFY